MNSEYRVQIAGPAKQDALSYAAYIRDENQLTAAAMRWIDGLYAAISDLRLNPKRFSVIPESEELGSTYRSFVYHSHRVIFAVDEDRRLVTVYRVYHGARRELRPDDL